MVVIKCTNWYKELDVPTRKKLAACCGIQKSHLDKIFNSKREPTLETSLVVIMFSQGYISIDDMMPSLRDDLKCFINSLRVTPRKRARATPICAADSRRTVHDQSTLLRQAVSIIYA